MLQCVCDNDNAKLQMTIDNTSGHSTLPDKSAIASSWSSCSRLFSPELSCGDSTPSLAPLHSFRYQWHYLTTLTVFETLPKTTSKMN